MYTVICLGSKACDVGELFESNNQYDVKLFDIDIEGENCFSITKQDSPEAYEKNCPDVSKFLRKAHDDIFFITSGDCEVASCALKILEKVKDKNINIFYIKPDTDFISKEAILLDKLYFNVFQEYTRSGIFKKIYLFDDKLIESSLGDVSVLTFKEEYSKFMYKTIHGLFSLKNIEPIINNHLPVGEINRIATIGFYNLENDYENIFFNLKNSQDKCYSFVINEEKLKIDNKLFKNIKDKIKQKSVNDIKISYCIYSTDSVSEYCLIEEYTKFIQ